MNKPDPNLNASAKERAWTPEQQRAIETTGHSLLVSAAAGSGKTAVLAQRCVYLVCDANPPCDIDQLLVVTFTDKAADEMRGRIAKALRQRAQQPDSRRAQEALALIDHAHISTLHSFCNKLLQQHFSLAGLDPAFRLLDGDEAALLRRETIADLFERRYDDEDGAFCRLVDAYGQGRDDAIRQSVLHVHELLSGMVDPPAWIERSRQRITQAIESPLEQSELGQELRALIRQQLDNLQRRAASAKAAVERLGVAPYAKYLSPFQQAADEWAQAAASVDIDSLANAVASFEPGRLPNVKAATPNKERAQAVVESLRKSFKEGSWRKLLRFSVAEWRKGLAQSLPHVETFIQLVREFGDQYALAKSSARAVDFSDLERLTLRVLCNPALESAAFVGSASADAAPVGSASADAVAPADPSVRKNATPSTVTSAKADPTNSATNGANAVNATMRQNNPPRLTPSPTARAYHHRFAHVLVDEYQDINSVQDAILALLSRDCLLDECPPQAGNLFCVGDVKQSIYRFRLAEAERFLQRERLFRSGAGRGKVIDLQANFRSRPSLLNAINGMFTRLMTAEAVDIEYADAHRLIGQLNYPPAGEHQCFDGAPIDLHLVPEAFAAGKADDATGAHDSSAGAASGDGNGDGDDLERSQREAIVIAREILRIVGRDQDSPQPRHIMEKDGAGGFSPRPARFGDIVILLRSMKFKADDFAGILRRFGIPVHADSRSGFFESMEIRDALALLSLLDNGRQDIPLASVLRSPLGGLRSAESALALIRAAYDAQTPFHEAVRHYRDDCADDIAQDLRAFYGKLSRWRQAAQRRPLGEVLQAIYQETEYLTYVQGLLDGPQRAANLRDLQRRAAQFGGFQVGGLSRFLRFLEALREESDMGQPSMANEAADVVRIMTIHQSKGLEFPIVIVPDLGKAINLKDCQGAILADRSAGLGLRAIDAERSIRYPSLASVLVETRLRQATLAEELRVLYVAVTRACEHLILIGTCKPKKPAEWSEQWSGHTGPLPADVILSARSMLDWLGPTAAAAGADPVLRVHVHDPADAAEWSAPDPAKAKPTRLELDIRRRIPLKNPPPIAPAAQGVIDRLGAVYRFAAYTRTPASQAVTRRAHGQASLGNGAASEAPPASSASSASINAAAAALPTCEAAPAAGAGGSFVGSALADAMALENLTLPEKIPSAEADPTSTASINAASPTSPYCETGTDGGSIASGGAAGDFSFPAMLWRTLPPPRFVDETSLAADRGTAFVGSALADACEAAPAAGAGGSFVGSALADAMALENLTLPEKIPSAEADPTSTASINAASPTSPYCETGTDGGSIASGGAAGDFSFPAVLWRTLPRPRFIDETSLAADRGRVMLSAAERGTATHLVLQHLSFASPNDDADVARQVDQLVRRRVLLEEQAKHVDVKAIAWLMASEVGQLLRRGSKSVRRELPVNFPAAPDVPPTAPAPTPLDHIMIRGRIDVLVLDDEVSAIIDYKTDSIRAEEVPSRAMQYLPQLTAYRDAISRIIGRPINDLYLVFLSPRVIWRPAGK